VLLVLGHGLRQIGVPWQVVDEVQQAAPATGPPQLPEVLGEVGGQVVLERLGVLSN
jgi:hypothetical protein